MERQWIREGDRATKKTKNKKGFVLSTCERKKIDKVKHRCDFDVCIYIEPQSNCQTDSFSSKRNDGNEWNVLQLLCCNVHHFTQGIAVLSMALPKVAPDQHPQSSHVQILNSHNALRHQRNAAPVEPTKNDSKCHFAPHKWVCPYCNLMILVT